MKVTIHDYAGHPFQVELSRQLASRGHTVTHVFAGGLLTPRGTCKTGPGDSERLEFREVPMNTNYRRDKYRFIKRRSMEVEYGASLCEAIRAIKPDVVISGNCPTEPQYAALSCCEEIGVPFVSWIQDFYSIAVDKLARKKLPLIGGLVGSWYKRMERKTLQRSAGIVSITEDFLPLLKEFGVEENRVAVIPNWATLDDLPVLSRNNEWARKHGLTDKFVFLYSGTLAMKHNPDLLRQLALTFQNHFEVRVVVISEGPGTEWLEKQQDTDVLHNLILLPFQDYSAMPEVFASADVLIAVLEPDAGIFSVPSKVLTYHCAGKPILAAIPFSNLAARIVQNEQTGLCVSPEDSESFVSTAAQFFENTELRKQCGRRARDYAEKTFDIGKIADRFEHFFENTLQSKGK